MTEKKKLNLVLGQKLDSAIRNALRQYPSGSSIIKELVQVSAVLCARHS